MKYIKSSSVHITSLIIGALVFTGCTSGIKDSFNQAKDLAGTVQNINVQLTANEGHVVIVPGYGAPVAGNESYEGYIDEVVEFVEDESNRVSTLVFTGSYSSLEDTSEAESMNQYFNSAADLDVVQQRGIKVIQEDCAIVSWQNIANSKDILDDRATPYTKVTVFGDVNREEKLMAFATYKFNEGIADSASASDLVNSSLAYKSIDFVGYDFGSAPEEQAEQDAKFAAEIAGAYDPKVGNEILELRINQWTKTFGYDVADNLVAKGCTEFAGFQ